MMDFLRGRFPGRRPLLTGLASLALVVGVVPALTAAAKQPAARPASSGSRCSTGYQGGYAAAATDCGVPPADLLTGAWALRSDGTLNMPLIDDFAFAGIHDMSVAGEAVTKIYYTSPLRFTYFNGCSTGGREGLMEAQRYPADYNGI